MSTTHNKKRIFAAACILSSGIIGAGVFSLPYVVRSAGLAVGFGLLVLATITYCTIHLMYADVVVGTAGQHRFVGYIARYLGMRWSYAAILMAVVQMILVLTIYLVLSISFMRLVAPALGQFGALGIFWLAGSSAIFLNRKRLAFAEVLVTCGIAAIITILFLVGAPHFGSLAGLPLVTSENILLPLSAIFFALSGRVAIVPLVNYFRAGGGSHKAAISSAVILGTVGPAAVYVVFVLAVLALSGVVSQDAVTGIIGAIPSWLAVGVGSLGLLSLWSSYTLVGLDVSDTLKYDLEIPHWLRFFVVVLVPPLFFFLGFTSLIGLVSFVGGVFLALEGLFVVLLWRQARRQKSLGGLIQVSRATMLFLWIIFAAALIGVVIS